MKTLFLFAIFSLATGAFAEVSMVNPMTYTCTELQTMLRDEGTLRVSGLFGFDQHFSAPVCPTDYKANYAYVRSLDQRFCGLGYICQLDMHGQ